MDNPVLTVIIPVYNAQNYIEKCLNSVLNGELKNIEIIIVNDNSNDETENILHKYLEDERIVLINNDKNIGTGASRNKGLFFARGLYVGFVDDDDWVDFDYFSSMVKKIEKEKSDICVSLKIENHKGKFSKTHLDNGKDLRKTVFVQKTAPWAKIFKKNFLSEYDIKFDTTRGEDIYPSFLSAYFAKKISYTLNSKYHCNIRQGSISRRKITTDDYNEIRLYKKILDFIKDKENKDYWLKLIKERSLISFDFLYKNADTKTKFELKKEYENIFSITPNKLMIEYRLWQIKNSFSKFKSFLNAF